LLFAYDSFLILEHCERLLTFSFPVIAVCFGLPGSSAPFGEFDPLGFLQGKDEMTVKRYREAEVEPPNRVTHSCSFQRNSTESAIADLQEHDSEL
jgi:hypothetical protein